MNYSFEGFRRSDGSVGIRNYIGVVSSVVCSSVVTKEISEKVPGAIPIVHTNGCAQLGDDFKVTKNMLVGVSSNPNLYSALLVGLGCETNQISGLLESIPETKPIKGIGIQQLSGGDNTIKKGVQIAEEWANDIAEMKRERFPVSSLNIGILSIDIDEETLQTVAPVIEGVVDLLIDHDATVMMGLSQTLEPAGELLSERAPREEVKTKLKKIGEGLHRKRWKKVTKDPVPVRDFSSEEKALAILESRLTGTKQIKSLLTYNEMPAEKGLHLIAVPSNVVEALSTMASSGCNIVMVVSSRGILTGSIALPSMTITSKNTSNSFDELTDYTVTEESVSIQVEKVVESLLAICSGKQTSIEKMELGEFSIPHVGTTF